MKKKLDRKKLILKPWVRVALSLFLIILTSISIYNIYRGNNPNNDATPKYIYNTESDIDYKVYLRRNNFYEEEYLPMDKQYAANLTDYIDIDFKYLYKGTLMSDMNYTYDIVATVIGESKGENNKVEELWNKKYTLLEKQNKNISNRNEFDLNQNIKIDYMRYLNIVENFKKNIEVPIDAYLNIKLSISYNHHLNLFDSYVKNIDELEVNIPLNTSTYNITTKYDKNKRRVLSESEVNPTNNGQIKFGIILLAISAILTMISLPKIIVRKKDYYLAELHKIMKIYKDIIVEVENEFDFDLDILDIKTFEDMVDIEKEIKSPILYYEITENEESWFIIVTDKYLYRYILRK